MTDEKIKNALHEADDMAINEDVDCSDVLAYINRLKSEITRIRKNWEISKSVQRTKNRKETAREVLQKCLCICKGQGDVCYDVDIKLLAHEYGVELNDEIK